MYLCAHNWNLLTGPVFHWIFPVLRLIEVETVKDRYLQEDSDCMAWSVTRSNNKPHMPASKIAFAKSESAWKEGCVKQAVVSKNPASFTCQLATKMYKNTFGEKEYRSFLLWDQYRFLTKTSSFTAIFSNPTASYIIAQTYFNHTCTFSKTEKRAQNIKCHPNNKQHSKILINKILSITKILVLSLSIYLV